MAPVRRLSARQVADDIAARIASGEHQPHTPLPTMRQLAELYSVSPRTVAKVIADLRERGLVYGVQGVGVFVEGPDD